MSGPTFRFKRLPPDQLLDFIEPTVAWGFGRPTRWSESREPSGGGSVKDLHHQGSLFRCRPRQHTFQEDPVLVAKQKKTSRAPASCVLISQSKAFDLWTWVLPRPAWVFGSPDCLMTGCEKLCLFECVLVCFAGCVVWVLVVLAEWDALCWFWFFGGLVAVWWLCGCLRAWLIFCVLVVWLFGCLVVWVVCPTRLYT